MLEIKITIDPSNVDKSAVYEIVKILVGIMDSKDFQKEFDPLADKSASVKSKPKRAIESKTLEAAVPQSFETSPVVAPQPAMPTLSPAPAPTLASDTAPFKDLAAIMDKVTPLMAEGKFTKKQLLDVIHSIDPTIEHVKDLADHPAVASKVYSAIDAWLL